MNLSASFVWAGAVQLFLLIFAVYSLTFWQISRKISPTVIDLFLLGVQVANLVVLLQYMSGTSQLIFSRKENYGFLLGIQALIALLVLFRFFFLIFRRRTQHQKVLSPTSVREAIDYLPGGICFAAVNGRPILTNHKMNELVFRLTGHTIMNAETTWKELNILKNANGYTKLENPWLNQEHLGQASDDSIYFSHAGGSIWRFRKEELTEQTPHYIQLDVMEITELYHYSKELYDNNRRLAQQYARQQNLLANIVKINNDKEILSMKMRIHDDLGRSIITTKQYLNDQTLSENTPYLAEIWKHTIRGLEDFSQMSPQEDISPEIELRKAAEMIGCQIHFAGQRPTGRKATLLLYATVREALTNAVRHANANQLYVTLRHKNNSYHATIKDNGTMPVAQVQEGNGLGNLRRRLEQEGATLWVQHGQGVSLVVELPADELF
ncbi:hypothetical protein LJC61_00460 [Ruminococcaceae bacterium OttesenSCG-928-A16]|nr:hypothetical protein [Ruminococcaceae bacterium OttesenSCG-928-A16]